MLTPCAGNNKWSIHPAYTYLHIYTYTYIHLYIYTSLHIYISTFLHIYISTYTYTYAYAYTHTHTHTCLYIYIPWPTHLSQPLGLWRTGSYTCGWSFTGCSLQHREAEPRPCNRVAVQKISANIHVQKSKHISHIYIHSNMFKYVQIIFAGRVMRRRLCKIDQNLKA